MKRFRHIYLALALPVAALAVAMAACSDNDIDNTYSKSLSIIQITTSSDYVVLDESTPDEVALTIEWSEAYDYGNEYITTYTYEYMLSTSSAEEVLEYEDDGMYYRSYTHKELQEILVDYFGQTTSTAGNMTFTVTATFQGPRTVIPDVATATVKVKTYGAKQFLADEVYVSGTAVGDDDIQMTESSDDVFTWTGELTAGTIYFPLNYEDDENAIGPLTDGEEITELPMECQVTDKSSAYKWTVTEEDTYKVTVSLAEEYVKIVSTASLVSADSIYMTGTAVDDEMIAVEQTLENEYLFAWRGELEAGTLYFPVYEDGVSDKSIVPYDASSHDINDGVTSEFGQVSTSSAGNSRYFEIPADDTYRIVIDLENKTITIYSQETDMQSKEVSWNNTVEGINPYTSTVEHLWMYGTFNNYAYDSGYFTGFQDKYSLEQSLANPYIFVYYGDVLPRNTASDDRGNSVKGSVRFTVSPIHNNVYAYGSEADAVRNSYNGYITVESNDPYGLVEGQGDNRYAYFLLPENCNYVEVDIENLTVIFDTK